MIVVEEDRVRTVRQSDRVLLRTCKARGVGKTLGKQRSNPTHRPLRMTRSSNEVEDLYGNDSDGSGKENTVEAVAEIHKATRGSGTQIRLRTTPRKGTKNEG